MLHALYFGLMVMQLIHLNFENAVIINTASFVIFLVGLLIISPSLNKDSETFSIKFLLMTTVQMLLFMLGIVVILYGGLTDQKITGFHFTGLFIAGLILQSVLLIKLKNH
jgi:hypothetical protein